MPTPSAFNAMTPEERERIEREIIRRNFTGYTEMTEWLNALGFDVGRTAVHKFGSKIQKRLQKVKDSTDAARPIASAVPDDDDSCSAAVISLVQSELFDVMVALQDLDESTPEERVGLLKEAARAIKDMTQASVLNKKWKQEYKAEVRKLAFEEAAEQVSKTAKAAGVSAETIKQIRVDVLGMVA